MPARGRTKGFVMSDEHRVKIQNSNILNALIEHALGNREMSSTQVTTGLGLLKKVLPDLQQTTLSGDPDNPLVVSTKDQRDAATAAAFRANT
jgi:hypothetical protein